jgi:hypothetical protein
VALGCFAELVVLAADKCARPCVKLQKRLASSVWRRPHAVRIERTMEQRLVDLLYEPSARDKSSC